MTTEDRDRSGRRRSPATYSDFRKGKSPKNKGRSYSSPVYQPTDVLRLLGAIPVETAAPFRLRDLALYSFVWRTGVQFVELERLRAMDLDPANGTAKIRRGAGGKEREAFLFGSRDAPDWAWQQLRPWLAKREELGIVSSAPLFCNAEGKTRGEPIGAPYARSKLKEYARNAKLHGNFTLRGLRNSLAAELYVNGVSVGQIQRQLGLQSLSSTQAMLERLGVVSSVDDLHDYRPDWRSDDGEDRV